VLIMAGGFLRETRRDEPIGCERSPRVERDTRWFRPERAGYAAADRGHLPTDSLPVRPPSGPPSRLSVCRRRFAGVPRGTPSPPSAMGVSGGAVYLAEGTWSRKETKRQFLLDFRTGLGRFVSCWPPDAGIGRPERRNASGVAVLLPRRVDGHPVAHVPLRRRQHLADHPRRHTEALCRCHHGIGSARLAVDLHAMAHVEDFVHLAPGHARSILNRLEKGGRLEEIALDVMKPLAEVAAFDLPAPG